MYNSNYNLPEEPPALKKVSTAPLVIDDVSVLINTETIKQQKEPLENLYKNPDKEGDLMSCCNQRYCFSYDRMRYLPKNPKLKYRIDGTIDIDPYSSQPGFSDYNGAREAIRQAKIKGLDHVHWRLSTASAEPLERDGYRGSDGGRLMNKDNDKICWGKLKTSPPFSKYVKQ